jgi:hypothetical protein
LVGGRLEEWKGFRREGYIDEKEEMEKIQDDGGGVKDDHPRGFITLPCFCGLQTYSLR